MEALWNLEDKYNVSTQGALLVFVCTAFLAIGLCAAILRRRAKNKQYSQSQSQILNTSSSDQGIVNVNEPCCCYIPIKKVLVGSVRWSRAHRWEEEGEEGSSPGPLLVVDGGWHSHNSTSPVWQRPILMGEKCELPRFSGLILYDQNGQLLPYNHNHGSYLHQPTTKQESVAAVRTTLKDLL